MLNGVLSSRWKMREGRNGEREYRGFGGAKSLAASATRSAVAFPIEVGSSPWVWELMCISWIGSFLILSMRLNRLSSSHSGYPMTLTSSPFRSASIRSIDDFESVQISTCQDDGNIIDMRVMASSSVL